MKLTPLRLLFVLFLVGVGTFGQTPPGPGRSVPSSAPARRLTSPNGPTFPSDFRQALSAGYLHGFPLAVAEHLLKHPRAKELLETALARWDLQDTWENATLVLGLSGEPGVYPTLLAFLQRDDSPLAHCRRTRPVCKGPSPLISPEIYYAKANVPVAMGLLLNGIDNKLPTDTSSPDSALEPILNVKTEILTLLTTGAHVAWHSEVYPPNLSAEMQLHLRLQCIDGLAVSGDTTALQRLKVFEKPLLSLESKLSTEEGQRELKHYDLPPMLTDAESVATLRRAVAVAIIKNEQIRSGGTDGLEKYYRPSAEIPPK